MITIWSIFWRTFAQLASAGLLTLGGVDLFSDYRAGATAIGLVLLSALVGALIAAGHAFIATPATTAIQKALRSVVQALIGVAALFVYNSAADVVNNGKLLLASVSAVILSGVVTYFQNQGTVPTPPPTTTVKKTA